MRLRASLVLLCVILSGAAWAQGETQVPVTKNPPPTLTAVQPVNPKAATADGPVIQSTSAHVPDAGLIGVVRTISPEFHFIAPKGNVVLVHREIVTSSANNPPHVTPSTTINVPAEVQKKGAVFSGGWQCGRDPAYTTLKAWLMDADGIKSNEVQYTIHCNGG